MRHFESKSVICDHFFSQIPLPCPWAYVLNYQIRRIDFVDQFATKVIYLAAINLSKEVKLGTEIIAKSNLKRAGD